MAPHFDEPVRESRPLSALFAASERGKAAMRLGATALAMTVLDLIYREEPLRAAWPSTGDDCGAGRRARYPPR